MKLLLHLLTSLHGTERTYRSTLAMSALRGEADSA
jgi:hypothetical protein